MLNELFPRDHSRYRQLPILGSTLDGFSEFLKERGYHKYISCVRVRAAVSIDRELRKRCCRKIGDITRSKLSACAPPIGKSQEDIHASATTHLLKQYFESRQIFLPVPLDPIETKVSHYREYLEKVRGLSSSSLHQHSRTVREFLAFLKCQKDMGVLAQLNQRKLETFVKNTGRRLSRESMQHYVAHLRSFLRFLVSRGEAPLGLDRQIDTPRVYRQEKLPRALPWDTVQRLLKSIDRSRPMGKRDYAMLLLIATYGLRASEVVALKLEDIEWRKSCLKISQRKTASPLLLPLTDKVGAAILAYLQKGRPPVKYREVFVRHRAPSGTLKPTAVNEVFQSWSRKSKLGIPFQGSHCIRHSYAVHLLRQGVSVKTIGDILGHRNAESTCVYLRLSVDDLRTVPLNLPKSITARRAQ